MSSEIHERPFELAGRIAIVVGGDQPVGREVACTLGHGGAPIVVAGKAMDHGHRTVEFVRALGGEAGFWNVDVEDESSVRELIEYTLGEFGKVDIVVLSLPSADSMSLSKFASHLQKFDDVVGWQEEDIAIVFTLPEPLDRAALESELGQIIETGNRKGRLWVNAVAGAAATADGLDKSRLRDAIGSLVNAARCRVGGTIVWV
jgi:NAD(P)-dependent dehydrogenase (short-subunit alcohol dehydrogenase family)